MDKKQVSNEECMYQSMFNFVELCRINVSESESESLFAQAQIKENIKGPRHWPLWGGFTGDWWIPLTKGQ